MLLILVASPALPQGRNMTDETNESETQSKQKKGSESGVGIRRKMGFSWETGGKDGGG